MSIKSSRKHLTQNRLVSQIGALTQLIAILDKRLTLVEERFNPAKQGEVAPEVIKVEE